MVLVGDEEICQGWAIILGGPVWGGEGRPLFLSDPLASLTSSPSVKNGTNCTGNKVEWDAISGGALFLGGLWLRPRQRDQ